MRRAITIASVGIIKSGGNSLKIEAKLFAVFEGFRDEVYEVFLIQVEVLQSEESLEELRQVHVALLRDVQHVQYAHSSRLIDVIKHGLYESL